MLYDCDIREPLFDFLEHKFGKIRILEEKTMGKSRADMVMITQNALFGIEIKSDADTYARLERQVKDYNLFYDYNYVVVGKSHAHVHEHIPDFWGIIRILPPEKEESAQAEISFEILREPNRNPKMNWKRKMRLLWRPELVHIQELNAMPKYKEKSKDFVIEKILLKVPEEVLTLQISEELFQRDYTKIAEIINQYRIENNQKPRRKRRRKRIKRI